MLTDSPLASNTAQWGDMYALNYAVGNIRQWTTGSLETSTGESLSSTDVLKINYSGTTISYYKNSTLLRSDTDAAYADLIFHGKIECYVNTGDDADVKEFENYINLIFQNKPWNYSTYHYINFYH